MLTDEHPSPAHGSGPRLGRIAAALLTSVALLFILGGVLVAQAIGVAHHSQQILTNRDYPALDDADALLAAFIDEETGTRGLLVTGNPIFLQPYTAAQPVIASHMTRLRDYTRGNAVETAQLTTVLADHSTWLQQVALPEQYDAEHGQLAAGRAIETSGIGKTDFDKLRAAADSFQVSLRDDRQRDEKTNSRDQTVVISVGATVLSVMLLVIGGLGLLLRRGVLRPLSSLADAAAHAAAGNHSASLPAAGPPEIRAVAAATERMRADLVAQLDVARQAREALEQRGQAVLALQRELTPRLEPIPGLAVAARLEAAEGVLAGDWYDQVHLDDGKVAVVVGDVSGHGAAAGAYALGLSRTLRASLAAHMTPGRALAHTAALLDDTEADERFASVFIVVLDISAGTAHYANAGHPDALLFSPDGRVQSLPPTGPLLATITATPVAWRTMPLIIPDRSVLLAVTDGLLEARNGNGDEYGTARLVGETVSALNRSGDSKLPVTADELLRLLFDSVKTFAAGRRSDDRTAIAVVRHASTLTAEHQTTLQHH